MKNIIKFFIWKINSLGLLQWIPTKVFLKIFFYCKTGKWLNLKVPKTFNEKIQWLKLYGFKPEYTQMADKYRARYYIIEKLRTHFNNPEQYLVPLLGVWDRFNEIDFGKLPEQFVLKTNHDSGTVILVSDKSKFDQVNAKTKLEKSLGRNYYWNGREPCYRSIEPKIIAEELLGSTNLNCSFENCEITTPTDYKIHCSYGIPQFIQVIGDRNLCEHKAKAAFYSPDWLRMEAKFYDYPEYDMEIMKPNKLEVMLEIASYISCNIVYCRIDMFEVQGKVYCGEITFYPLSGMYVYPPEKEKIGTELGCMIDITKIDKN